MFKKILYPTDFSDVAQSAIKYIEQLRSAGSQEVIILHVIDIRVLDLLIYNPMVAMEFEQYLRSDAESRISDIRERLEETGYTVQGSIEVGIPAETILRKEEEDDPSIIVLGSHGKSNVREMLLGSVSEAVIRASHKPLLVVKR